MHTNIYVENIDVYFIQWESAYVVGNKEISFKISADFFFLFFFVQSASHPFSTPALHMYVLTCVLVYMFISVWKLGLIFRLLPHDICVHPFFSPFSRLSHMCVGYFLPSCFPAFLSSFKGSNRF